MTNELQHDEWQPAAVALAASGELAERARQIVARLAECDLCPHDCRSNRLNGKLGRCRTGALAHVASVCDHHGEEPVLSGERGAGTVFFAGCNLRCVYCQNQQISRQTAGQYPAYTAGQLADAFLQLQALGCHNLDLVSPTHVVAQVVEALARAIPRGLRLPVVYNTNAFETLSTLALLDGIVDIYLPDLKYADDESGRQFSGASGYPDIAIAAIREMYRQVGDLQLDNDGIARRGVIVRHLVLPNRLAGTREALRRLAEEVSPTITVSLMAQYYPTELAAGIPALSRTLTAEEYDEALDAFEEAGLENGWQQELAYAPGTYRPDFRDAHPFEAERKCK
ncbi:MAG TPA: radical SAM protein [Armatimonadota bacterium]